MFPAATKAFRTVDRLVPRAAAESIESEIARLTWAILDGSANAGDSRRLSQLVESTYANRPRNRPLPAIDD